MDCLKNLTACQGCTKKHAKCSWKDVTDQELRDNPYVPRSEKEELSGAADSPEIMSVLAAATEDGPVRSVRDEELLGEDASDDYVPSSPKERPHGPEPVDHIMGEAKSYGVRTSEESRDISQPVEPEDRMAISVEQTKNPATVNEASEAQLRTTNSETDHDRVRVSGSFEAINHSSMENKAQVYPTKYEELDQEKTPQSGHPDSRGSEQDHHVDQKIWSMISNHSTPRDEQSPNDVKQKHVWASIPSQIGTDRS